MTISAMCPNGHKLKAKDSHAGRSLPCPACGATVAVPSPQDNVLPSADPLGEVDLSSGESQNFFAAQAPASSQYAHVPVSRPAAASPAPKQAASDLTLYLLIGGGVGGSLLAILLLLVAWFVLSRGGKEDSPNEQVAQATAGTMAAAEEAPGDEASPLTVTTTPNAPTEVTQNVGEMLQDIKAKILGSESGRTNPVQVVTEKLRQIGLAFHNFHDTYRVFAFARVGDLEVVEPNRQPPPTGLSWRVHLLPYLDQKPLYDSFHLDEPWDSPHNKTLLDKMPEVYRIEASDETTTRFQVLTGSELLFGNPTPPRIRDLSDGARHTILALVTGPDRAVPWTKPDELTLDPSQPVASLGAMPDHLIMCVMADGKPLILRDSIERASFLALTTPHGKEIIDAETFRRQFEEESWDAMEDRASNLSGLIPKPTPGTSSTPGTPAASPSPAQLLGIVTDRSKKLKDLVLAMHNYHDTYRQFPVSKNTKYYGPDGKPFLSWRVHVLPFLDQQPLYDQFKLDEPWDSPNNRPLLDKMPEVFRDPQSELGGTKTRYVTLTGPDTSFSKPQGPSLREFRDGTSNTLLIVMSGPDKAVDWTKPVDIEFDPSSPVACLGAIEDPVIFYARADGAVKIIQSSIPTEMFKALVTPAGGEQLPREFANFEVR